MPKIVASPVTLIADTLRAVPVVPTNGSASRVPCCRLTAPVNPVAAPRMKRSPAAVEPEIVRLPVPVRAASRLMPVEALAVSVLPEAMAIGRAEPALQSGRTKVASPVTLIPEELAAALAAPKASVPAPRLIAPPKVLAPESVSVPAEALVRLPVAPEMMPAKVPSLTVRAVELPRATAPPLSVAIEDVEPLRFNVPVVRVVIVATPPTVVVPPLTVVTVAAPVIVLVPPATEEEVSEPAESVPVPAIVPFTSPVTVVAAAPEISPASEAAETVPPETLAPRAPTTVTLPTETPPVMSASLPKRVLPAPARLERVTLPVEAVKLSALAVVPSLVIAPEMVRSEPEIVAVEAASSAKVAAAL